MVHSFMDPVHSAYTLLLISNLFSDHRIVVFISLPLCILTVCFGSVHPNHALLPLAVLFSVCVKHVYYKEDSSIIQYYNLMDLGCAKYCKDSYINNMLNGFEHYACF